MTQEKTPNRWLPFAALLLVQLIFGFNYAAAKVILATYPPFVWGAMRLSVATVLMFAVAFAVVPKEERKVDRSFLMHTFIYSFFGLALNQSFFLYGLRYTTASNSAILNTLTPIFTLMFAILLRREIWTAFRGVGFTVAIVGVLILRNVEDFHLSSETAKGDIFTLLNCACLAIFFTISREFFKKNSPIWSTAWMFLYSAIMMSVVSYPDWGNVGPISFNSTVFWAMVYNIVGATMVTYLLNSWTLTKVKSSSVAIFIYIQPVIAVLNSWVTYHEVPTLRTVLAMCFIFVGVGLGILKRA